MTSPGASRRLRAFGTSLKINLAMQGPLDFKALPGVDGPQHQALTDIGPSLDYIQKAYDDAKWGRLPEEPPLSVFCQTAWDSTMAPKGVHTLSIIASTIPTSWRTAPGSPARSRPSRTPCRCSKPTRPASRRPDSPHRGADPPRPREPDRLHGGERHPSRPDPQSDALLPPPPGVVHYRTPLEGLYLCGAGTHPGGGVKGAPGHNAAHVILEDSG